MRRHALCPLTNSGQALRLAQDWFIDALRLQDMECGSSVPLLPPHLQREQAPALQTEFEARWRLRLRAQVTKLPRANLASARASLYIRCAGMRPEGYKSFGVSPVCFATRANILGPISSPSWIVTRGMSIVDLNWWWVVRLFILRITHASNANADWREPPPPLVPAGVCAMIIF